MIKTMFTMIDFTDLELLLGFFTFVLRLYQLEKNRKKTRRRTTDLD